MSSIRINNNWNNPKNAKWKSTTPLNIFKTEYYNNYMCSGHIEIPLCRDTNPYKYFSGEGGWFVIFRIFKGPPRWKKTCLLFTWEKNVLNKTYLSCGSKHSLLLDFFCKTKKTICIENIGFLGILQKIYFLQFHR